MGMIISPRVREKLGKPDHDVTEVEIVQCFANREAGDCLDTREEHRTDPVTRWFVAETDRGRRLKIVYMLQPGDVEIKSAYPANDEVTRIYRKFAQPL